MLTNVQPHRIQIDVSLFQEPRLNKFAANQARMEYANLYSILEHMKDHDYPPEVLRVLARSVEATGKLIAARQYKEAFIMAVTELERFSDEMIQVEAVIVGDGPIQRDDALVKEAVEDLPDWQAEIH